MVTYNQLLNAKPGKLSDSADEGWDAWAGALRDYAGSLNWTKTTILKRWNGDASAEGARFLAEHHSRVMSSAGQIDKVKSVLKTASTEFMNAHNTVVAATNKANSLGWTITGDDQVSVTIPANQLNRASPAQSKQMESQRKQIESDINDALNAVSRADTTVAGRLRGLTPSNNGGSNGTDLSDNGGTPSFTPTQVDYPGAGDVKMPPNILANVHNPHAKAAIAYAKAQLGDPYVYGAEGPNSFDCSGLVMRAYQAAGISLPRTADLQWSHGPRVSQSQVQAGDLVFFAGSDGSMSSPGHVGIVIDPEKHLMIEAPHTGSHVRVSSYVRSDLVGFTRPGAPAKA